MKRIVQVLMMFALVLLTACSTGQKLYKQQLDFLGAQVAANHAADAARADRLAERETACAGLTDAGSIAACMLGITATTLADRAGNGSGQGIVMAPAPPRSPLEIGAGVLVEAIRTGAPIAMGIVSSNNARKVSIDNNRQLFGYLGEQSQAWSQFGSDALAANASVSTAAVDVLPDLAPSISVTGNGNNVGDGNTSAVDQSTTGRDRITLGDGGVATIDQSSTGGDRQQGTNNRLNADDINTTITCAPAAGAAAPGAVGDPAGNGSATGGAGGSVSAIDCSNRGG